MKDECDCDKTTKADICFNLRTRENGDNEYNKFNNAQLENSRSFLFLLYIRFLRDLPQNLETAALVLLLLLGHAEKFCRVLQIASLEKLSCKSAAFAEGQRNS